MEKEKTKSSPSVKARGRQYNARLVKGGALLEDMRILVRNWQDGNGKSRMDVMVAADLLGKHTRARALDTYQSVFIPRFVNGHPPDAWKITRELEEKNMPIEILRPVYYWITARKEHLLYDFVCQELADRSKSQGHGITTDDAIAWLKSQIARCGKAWSEMVTKKVAQGMLAALRDFGILEGAVRKRIAPVYIPVESFAYIAFALDQEGATGARLMGHPDWSLFLLAPPAVEHMFLDADRNGLLHFQAAGKIVRIEFPAHSFKEMADVIAVRAH